MTNKQKNEKRFEAALSGRTQNAAASLEGEAYVTRAASSATEETDAQGAIGPV